jgi:capsid portal protein
VSVKIIQPNDDDLPVVEVSESAFSSPESDDGTVAVLKATYVESGREAANSSALPLENFQGGADVWSDTPVIPPAFNPDEALYLIEHCPALRPLLDALCTMVDGLGHRAKPRIKLESKESDLLIRQILREELGREPRPNQIKKRKAQIEEEMWAEVRTFEHFFSNCTEGPFEEFRVNRRFDLEGTGNSYFELLRAKPKSGDLLGDPVEFVLLPAFTMRMTARDRELTETECWYVDPLFRLQSRKKRKRFCRYIQSYNNGKVYYKELGDPRVISRKTGKVWPNLEALQQEDPTDGPATEVVHSSIFTSRSGYGIPRWSGDVKSAYSVIDAQAINNRFLTNNSIPPLALLVSGGRLSANTVPRLEKFIKERIAGKNSFGSMLILEADGGMSSGRIESSERFNQNGRIKIELKPLSEAVTKEGMFLSLIDKSTEGMQRTFRMSQAVLGKAGANKQSDQFQLQLVDALVANPLRRAFDQWVNKFILPELGIRYHLFESKGPVSRDPNEIAEWLRNLSNGGILKVAEGREKASELLDMNLPNTDEEFLKHPPLVYLKLLDQETAKMSRTGSPERGTPGGSDKEIDTQYAESGGEEKSRTASE